jgi:glycosyltransferase involved in cell wall biosynthesis
MKIGLFVPSWPPGFDANGIVSYAANIVPALRRIGHEVFVLTPNSAMRDPYTVELTRPTNQAVWKRLRSRLSPRPKYESLVLAVRRLVEAEKIHVFEMEESFGWSSAISELNIVPVVVRLHGPWFLNKTFSDDARESAELAAIRAATFISSPSRSVLNSVVDRSGILSHASVVYNPIDPPLERWNMEQCNKDSILFVGRFDEIKGGDLVLRAFDALAKKNPKLRLTFVGKDIGINGQQAAEYAKDHLSPDALSRLTFRGQLSPLQIAQLRLNHFMTLSASRFEVFGYTVLEALASGCPLVAPNVGGIPEMVISGRNGILFEPGNAESLSLACQILLDNRALATQLGSSGREACESIFGTGRAARHTEELYRQAIEKFQRQKNA